MKFIIAITVLFQSITLFAASGAGNGEKGILSANGTVTVLDLIRLPKSAYLDAAETDSGKLLSDSFKNKIMQQISYFPMEGRKDITQVVSFGDVLQKDFKTLKFYLTPGPLDFTNDVKHITYKNDVSGVLVQIAVQDAGGNVAIDRNLYAKMSINERKEMFRHETLIRAYYQDTKTLPLTTDAIMDLVHLLNGVDPLIPVTARSVAIQACSARLPVKLGDWSKLKRVDNIFDPNRIFSDQNLHVASNIMGCDSDGIVLNSFKPLVDKYKLVDSEVLRSKAFCMTRHESTYTLPILSKNQEKGFVILTAIFCQSNYMKHESSILLKLDNTQHERSLLGFIRPDGWLNQTKDKGTRWATFEELN